MKKILIAGIFSLCMYLPNQALAWGQTGHRVVGEIADRHLSSKARLAIKKILGFESIAMASTWADFIKSDTSYKYIDSWHYVNLPEGLDRAGVYSYLEAETMPNIYNKTNDMIQTLKNTKSTASEKLMALRLLIHFIGDLHQPMHTARKDDLGGNRFGVNWFNEKTNLHSVWDTKLVEFQGLSYTEYATAINHATPIELVNIKKSNVKDAIYESYEACNKIYAKTIANSNLSYNYNYEFVNLLNTQLRNGGIRLATILNSIYG